MRHLVQFQRGDAHVSGLPRGRRGAGEASAGVSPETLRKIETGRAPTPAFFRAVRTGAGLTAPVLRRLRRV
ncbi:hypothetical protein [Streptomyces chartreusis]|uniref:hypothetical protein n=1 Tax=Streptomyces chartreusis TaxID=1969 RepID=UPI0033B48264